MEKRNRMNQYCTCRLDRGFSIIEFMIAMTLGLLVMAAVSSLLFNTSSANREVEKANAQIENGRIAVSILRDEIKLAGFYGDYGDVLGTAPALPALCNTIALVDLQASLIVPLQTVSGAAANALAGCGPAPTVKAGTDIIVVRRADTIPICGPGTLPASHIAPTVGDYYIQSRPKPSEFEIQVGGGGFAFGTTKADGTPTQFCRAVKPSASADRLCPTVTITANTAGTCAGFTAGAINKLHISVFFISPCNVCAGSRADTLPTLKRLVLSAGGFTLEPLVEGIENLAIQLGVDTSPTSDVVGYGSPDKFVDTPADMTELANVVAARIYVLSRSIDTSLGHTDTKSFVLGTRNIAAANDGYKRHVFNTLVRIENLALCREIPS